jgi:MFS family permease
MILLSACTGAKFRYLNKVRADRKPQPDKIKTIAENRKTFSTKPIIADSFSTRHVKTFQTKKKVSTHKKSFIHNSKSLPQNLIQHHATLRQDADASLKKPKPEKKKKQINASAISTWLLFATFILLFFAAATELPILIVLVFLLLLGALFFGIYGWVKNRKKYNTATKISFWMLIAIFGSLLLGFIFLPEVFVVAIFISFLGSIIFGIFGMLIDSSNRRKELGIPKKKYTPPKPDDLAISLLVLSFLIFMLAINVAFITALVTATFPISVLILVFVLLLSSVMLGVIAFIKFLKNKNWILTFITFAEVFLSTLFLILMFTG